MKKILAIILVLMLAFSMLLITACNNNTADTDTEVSSTVEETSSGRKRGEGAGSDKPSTPGTTSGDDSSNSTGGDEPGGKPQTPPDTDYEYGDYDYDYKETAINPTDPSTNAGGFDMLIYLFSQDFSKPSLSDDFYNTLVSYENEYNKLSATDKGAVQNYKFLLEARTAYNGMAKKESEKIISELPDATIDNLTEFAIKANAVDKLIKNLGSDAAAIPNKDVYNKKVEAADSLLINTFNQQVSALQTFEYSAAYKAKLDDAGTIYQLMNATQQSKVAASYATLTGLQTRYADAAVAYSFVDTVNALPDVNSLKDTDQAIIKQLKKTYNRMTPAEKAEIPAATQAKYEAYIAKAQQLWPEHVLHTFADTKQGDEFFVFNTKFNGANRPEAPVLYEDLKQVDGLKFIADRRITFKPQKAGVLTVYANIRNKASDKCDMVLKLNGTEIARQTVTHDATGENTEYTFACNTVGTYELSAEIEGDGGILYYLIFS